MKALEDKVQELERKLDQKKAADAESEFEAAKRSVKEEASKPQVNIDILHEKLILLDNTARKQNHEFKDKASLILNRFHVYKSQPKFAAALTLKLICTKEEETVLDKEQKLLKSFPLHDNVQAANFFQQGSGFMGGPHPFQNNHPYVLPNRYPVPPRRMRPRVSSTIVCFKCNRPGHVVRDCPSNQNTQSQAN